MSNYGFVKTYKLSQQTPLIHFQYDQEGATLRATEVKPKLDRYLTNKYGEETTKQWRIDPDKKNTALNYRMIIRMPELDRNSTNLKISNTHETAIKKRQNSPMNYQEQIKINAMYFGNMVNDRLPLDEYTTQVNETYKETVFYEDRGTAEKIELTIVCRNKSLFDRINESIETFFSLYNFGTRQSKGFGGFKVIGNYDPLTLIHESEIPYFYFVCDGDYDKKMSLASAVYSIMKGGVNRRYTKDRRTGQTVFNETAYVQGYIQRQYLNDLGLTECGCEKIKLKADILGIEVGKQYSEYLFVRALLGLPDHYEFRNLPSTGTVNVYSLGESTFDIQRFHSPVTIKIIDDYVFFLFGNVDEILKKTFYLFYGSPSGTSYEAKKKAILNKNESNRINNHSSITIQTPETVDWNFFIQHFKAYFEKEKAKTDTGMIKCGYPFKQACELDLLPKPILKKECENK